MQTTALKRQMQLLHSWPSNTGACCSSCGWSSSSGACQLVAPRASGQCVPCLCHNAMACIKR
jgi:hypothetical protein